MRKFLRLGNVCEQLLREENLAIAAGSIKQFQFDEMETFEHTKCKPLSIHIAVEETRRRILGFRVSSMPAKGKLAKISREKYGIRADGRAAARRDLFMELKPLLTSDCVIKSDKNPHYTADMKKHFPGHEHIVSKGRRGCVTGQGEMKRGGHDPIFSLNHTYAMLRANICRLFRRTWNTTKKPDGLAKHLAIYAIFHNRYLINFPSK